MSFLQSLAKNKWWLLAVATLVLFGYIALKPSTSDDSTQITSLDQDYELKYVYGNKDSSELLLRVPIKGVILNEDSDVTSFWDQLSGGVTYGYSVKEQLIRTAEDERIKGVILDIDSPGGTITGSKAISDGVLYYRQKTGKPVYAYAVQAASGGYWSAVSADKIIADHGSIVGSIGVIMGQLKQYDEVVQEGSILGGVTTRQPIKTVTLSAGGSKDIGNPYRALTAEEQQHLQVLLDNEYEVFVNFVAERRGIPADIIRTAIRAHFYEPNRAILLKLIDEINTREAAMNQLAQRAELSESDFQVVEERESLGFLDTLLSASTGMKAPEANSWAALNSLMSFQPLVLHDPDGRIINSF